jgi:protein TonB
MMVRISPEVMQTRLLTRIDPVYPPEAQALHIEGTVVLRLYIDTAGNVFKVVEVSGPEFLVRAASDAVKQWKYKPYALNGTPIKVETTIDVKFAP